MNDSALRSVLTRRGLLKLGGGVVVASLFGIALGARSILRDRPSAGGRKVFDDEEARVLSALAGAWFPAGNILGVAADDVDVVSSCDAYAARLLPRERTLLRVLLR